LTLEPTDHAGSEVISDLRGTFQLSATGEWEPWDPQQKTGRGGSRFGAPADYGGHALDPDQAAEEETHDKDASEPISDRFENGERGSDRQEGAQFVADDFQYDSRYVSVASDRTSVRTFYTTRSRQTAGSCDSEASNLSGRTPWRQTLHDKYLIVSKFHELDWSGRGQHVEFGPDEDSTTIDKMLIPQGVLGHTATALVEKVLCKRIMLARKKITCIGRLKREEAIEEVAHLQRLLHAHVVRCVGTYVHGKHLSILLYPATAYNLETFLDRCVDLDKTIHPSAADGKLLHDMRKSILKFFKCLASTISYTHDCLVKHMDIKPSNLLIQEKIGEGGTHFQIYLADFGIARAYTKLSEVETESYTLFTKTYAAPEVVRQDKRGLSADIFSLGCVFLEMLSFFARRRETLIEVRRSNAKGDASYQANLDVLREDPSLLKMDRNEVSRLLLDDIRDITVQMLDPNPELRPTAYQLMVSIGPVSNTCCTKAPEPFEATISPKTASSALDVLEE